jgi:hypothetical protein
MQKLFELNLYFQMATPFSPSPAISPIGSYEQQQSAQYPHCCFLHYLEKTNGKIPNGK